MAKPTTVIKGFVRLTIRQAESTEMLISLQNISTVRAGYDTTSIHVLNSPFTRAVQELTVLEAYEEVLRRIKEASF